MADENPGTDDMASSLQPLPGAALPAEFMPTSRADSPPRRGRRPADDAVSLGLRQLWRDVELEPVPAEFFDLLDAIDAARGKNDDGTGQ